MEVQYLSTLINNLVKYLTNTHLAIQDKTSKESFKNT